MVNKKHLFKPKHVSDPFVDLGKTQVTVAVHVHPIPNIPAKNPVYSTGKVSIYIFKKQHAESALLIMLSYHGANNLFGL